MPERVGPTAPEDTPIVVVDDEQAILTTIEKVLSREGYPVEVFTSGQEALNRIAEGGVALLITDVRMPVMGGMELTRRALEEDPDLAVLVLTGLSDVETAVESLRLGVEDYLTKPLSIKELIEAVDRALRRRVQDLHRHKLEAWLRAEVEKRTEQVLRQAEELEQVSVATLSALVRAMEAKETDLRGHSERVAELCYTMGEQLGFSARELEELRVAGLLHDIGMIAIRELIVFREGPLSEDEYRHVQEHVEVGANILEPLTHLGRAVQYVRTHHERLNGSGYPLGLKGQDIPLGGQIVGLAEMFVSMTENRTYRTANSQREALESLRQGQGIWFETRVFDALEEGFHQA